MRNIFVLLIVAMVAYFAYQKYPSDELQGKWQLNVEEMAKQLVDSGAPQSSVEVFKKQLGSGKTVMTISKISIDYEIAGQRVNFPYSIQSKDGGCTTIEADGKILKNCVKGSTLKVYNQTNSRFEVYDRL